MLSLVLLILPIHDDDDCIFRVNGHDRDLCGHGYALNDDHECETVSCSSFLIFFYVHSCGDAQTHRAIVPDFLCDENDHDVYDHDVHESDHDPYDYVHDHGYDHDRDRGDYLLSEEIIEQHLLGIHPVRHLPNQVISYCQTFFQILIYIFELITI